MSDFEILPWFYPWYEKCRGMFYYSEELISLLNNYETSVSWIKKYDIKKIDTNKESLDPKLVINYNEYLFVFYWYYKICWCADYIYNFKKYATKFNQCYLANKEVIDSFNNADLNIYLYKFKNDEFTNVWLDLYFNIDRSDYKKRTTLNEITNINNFSTEIEECFNDLKKIPLINQSYRDGAYYNDKPMSIHEYKISHEVDSGLFGHIQFKTYCEKIHKKIPVIESMSEVKKFLKIHYENYLDHLF